MKQQSWIILSLVFALIIAVFAVINVDSVEVDFLFTTTHAPLILVILFSALLGSLLVVGFSFSKIYQLQRQLREAKQYNEQTNKGFSLEDSLDKQSLQDNEKKEL
ncbi:LapA family protein [Bacillaceae bacterium W0354]